MTLDEILDAYADRWRVAAMEDAKQFRGMAGGGQRSLTTDSPGLLRGCALLAPDYFHIAGDLTEAAATELVKWRCECGFSGPTLAVVMIHLNNAHDWTWDMFAGKFRDALAQGMAR